MASCSEFQVQLARICDNHRTDMKLFNKINQLIKKHSFGRLLSFSLDHLSTTKLGFIKNIGKSFQAERLQPTNVAVPLALGGSACSTQPYVCVDQVGQSRTQLLVLHADAVQRHNRPSGDQLA